MNFFDATYAAELLLPRHWVRRLLIAALAALALVVWVTPLTTDEVAGWLRSQATARIEQTVQLIRPTLDRALESLQPPVPPADATSTSLP